MAMAGVKGGGAGVVHTGLKGCEWLNERRKNACK